MDEPDRLSRCCGVGVRRGERLAYSGGGLVDTPVFVCERCGRECGTRLVWNTLPPPGTFEADGSTPFREPFRS